jgi:class 3 adenylate cyclase
VDAPETRYARSGDLHVAYQLIGEQGLDIVVLTQWFSNVDSQWDLPPLASFMRRLAAFGKVVTFDKRGTGLSDPVPASALPSIEEWMDDLRAVMDDAGVRRAALVANLASCFMALQFAATYPDRVSSLALINAYPRFTRTDGYPFGSAPEDVDAVLEQMHHSWGRGTLVRQFAPSAVDDATLVQQTSRYERQAASPGSAIAMVAAINVIDVRAILPAVQAPVLAISRAPAAVAPEHRRYVADHVPRGTYLELAGEDELMWAGDQLDILGHVQEFLTGARPVIDPDRVLMTVLFTDIVGSTETAAALGDRAWRDLLERHHEHVRARLTEFRGREVDTAGDGFLAVFDGPGRAIRCAQAAVEGVHTLGLRIRAGLHTGELEIAGDQVRGIAVHIGARVAALAGPSEVLVSSTVRDLVAGSGLLFHDRGTHGLKGVPDAWHVYALDAASVS